MKKQVFIHSKRRVVVMNGKQVPRLLLSIIQGSIGKKFVVKHYKGRKIVITRFPDMSRIVASEKQRVRRNLFREAVVREERTMGNWQLAIDNRQGMNYEQQGPWKALWQKQENAVEVVSQVKNNGSCFVELRL
jgi:hypothetical protein